jgi:hypothetical protein
MKKKEGGMGSEERAIEADGRGVIGRKMMDGEREIRGRNGDEG